MIHVRRKRCELRGSFAFILPNFRSVSAGSKPHTPGWKYNFTVASHQAFDYSSFIFLGLTSITAEGLNEHLSLGKGVGGFYAYTWRGFLDKTDGTYLSAWLLPSLLHEDTRFYPAARCNPILPFSSKRSRLPNPVVRGAMATPVGAAGSKVRFARQPGVTTTSYKPNLGTNRFSTSESATRHQLTVTS